MVVVSQIYQASIWSNVDKLFFFLVCARRRRNDKDLISNEKNVKGTTKHNIIKWIPLIFQNVFQLDLGVSCVS